MNLPRTIKDIDLFVSKAYEKFEAELIVVSSGKRKSELLALVKSSQAHFEQIIYLKSFTRDGKQRYNRADINTKRNRLKKKFNTEGNNYTEREKNDFDNACLIDDLIQEYLTQNRKLKSKNYYMWDKHGIFEFYKHIDALKITRKRKIQLVTGFRIFLSTGHIDFNCADDSSEFQATRTYLRERPKFLRIVRKNRQGPVYVNSEMFDTFRNILLPK